MEDHVYCYPGSNVLINKLDIRDLDKLHEVERKLTNLRIMELIENPIDGEYDLAHLMKIHYYIFQDIYDWAGKVRTVDIAKGNMFCNVKFIFNQAEDIFEKLRKDNLLKGFLREDFIKKIAFYFSEINALHPFREGNGRTQREFIRSLAAYNGYQIKFVNITEDEMIRASQESFLCNYELMERLFSKCIV